MGLLELGVLEELEQDGEYGFDAGLPVPPVAGGPHTHSIDPRAHFTPHRRVVVFQ